VPYADVQIAELRELELLEQFQDVFAWVYRKASWDHWEACSRDMQQHNSLIADCEIFPCDFVMDLEYFSYYILYILKFISEFHS
jgi:hypothetical protein